MKELVAPVRTIAALSFLFVVQCFAQPQAVPANGLSATADSDYAIAQVGPHSRVWQNSAGQSVTEIATGMNYLSSGQWLTSDNSFALSQDGTSFVADKIQDPTRIAVQNIATQGAVQVVTPQGVTLNSTPTAIALYDAASGLSVVVASITNAAGVMVDPQHIVFSHAFLGGGFDASVVYSLPDTGSFHQDVIFTGFDPNFDPTVWGFAAGSTNTLQIQILTEFYNAPQPQAQERDLYIEQDANVRASMASPDIIDYTLDWGDYVMGPGRAYTTSPNAGGGGVAVEKDFVTTSGRQFLVETIPLRSILGQLQSLPPTKVKTASLKLPHARKQMIAAASVPSLPTLKASAKGLTPANAVKLAGNLPRGVDIDYQATVSGAGPTVFASDTTYFVSGTVYLTGPVTMEAAVFKFPTSSGSIEIENTLALATTNYRTAIFTSADDNSAGVQLGTNIWSGYTGTPSGDRYGGAALWLNTSANIALNNLRFCYMNIAIEIGSDTAGQKLTLSNLQMVDCFEGIYVYGSSNTNASLIFNMYNCLMADVGTPFFISGAALAGGGCNCTVDACANLFSVGTTSGTFNFTNSIISSLTSKGTLGSLTLGGTSNVFFNSSGATFGSFNPLIASPYVSAGAGDYYITNNSSYLTNGTASLPAALLAQLQMKTTQAPLWLTNTFTNSTTVTPVVQRDTAGTALGWHYEPIDFLASCAVRRSSTTLTLTNGVALAYYNDQGISVDAGTQIISQGAPTQRNYIVYYGLVQEEPIRLDTNVTLAQSYPIVPALAQTNGPVVFLRLTTICAPAGETNILNTGGVGNTQSIDKLTLQDCEVYGSGAVWAMNDANNLPAVELVNNLFYRVPFSVNSYGTNTCFNNLFYGTTNVNVTNTTISIQYRGGSSGSSNTNENNVYDGVTVALDGTAVGYNGYLHGAVNIAGGVNTDKTNALIWQAGPLGSFYQPTGSPFLNNGSASAASLGLYHYTVLTTEAVEGSSTVSRGYHYVALTNTTGSPLDNNSDGVPDYLEDVNGDGINNGTEEDWIGATSPWIGTQPVNQYAVTGTPATFSVTAYGSGGLTYQWYKNTTSLITGATSSTYTIPSVGSGDVASYSVTVNSSVSTSSATLTLVIPPQLTNFSPALTTPYWFQSSFDTLSLGVSNQYGSATPALYSQYLDPYLRYLPSYEWEYNGVLVSSSLSSGTNVFYRTTNDTPTVVVSNPAGSTNLTWTNVFLANPGMVENWGNNAEGQCNRPVWLTNAAAIAAGEYHSIAVTDTGLIVQWGKYSDTNTGNGNFYSVTDTSVATLPPTSNVMTVAAGTGQALALLNSNGTVVAWGLTNDPSASVPNGLVHTNMIAIACGWQFNLELTSGARIIAWGTNTYGQTNVPLNTNVTAIAAGAYHGLAVNNGAVVAWGRNNAGQCTVPVAAQSGVVAVAAGSAHSLALLANGTVVAWGDNTFHQTNVPAGLSNVMAIAAGDNHCVALLNTGTIVEWGDGSSGQANVPQSNPTNSVNVKLIAAGGNHAMAGIWSSWVQYPVNVAKDLLLIYNTNSLDSLNVCQYYLSHRPMVSRANVLGIGCTTNETLLPSEYTNIFNAQLTTWLNLNPTKRPSYVILFPCLPSRVNTDTNTGEYDESAKSPSVQYRINQWCATNWHPFVTSINMNGAGGANDCYAYINKLTNMAGASPTLFISATAKGYGSADWYFDDSVNGSTIPFDVAGGYKAEQGVLFFKPSASVFYESASVITTGTNVAGYFSPGVHNLLFNGQYPINAQITFSGQSSWYLIETDESFNGFQIAGHTYSQGNYLEWFATNAFGGTSSSNTPVGAVTQVDEPGTALNNPYFYFGLWASGKIFASCAWNSFYNYGTPYPQVIGDPFTRW
jgi:hypothetical protein